MKKLTDAQEQKITSAALSEYETSKQNRSRLFDDFETYLALLESERDEREYEWMSDIRIPEFVSILHTQMSLDVDQYFSTRDYTEVYVEDESPEALASAEAAKRCINRTLNCKDLYHYQKFVRAKMLSYLSGDAYLVCRWEKKLVEGVVGENQSEEFLGFDPDYNPLYRTITEPVMGPIPLIDRFQYDTVDPRNFFSDNKQCYSLQEKDWVIVRSEATLDELKKNAGPGGFFGLDKLHESIAPPAETETSQETYNKEESQQVVSDNEEYDILTRFGGAWVMVKKRDPETKLPLEIEPGHDDLGNIRDGAEYHEIIQVFAKSGAGARCIAYHPTPYVDASGKPFKPVIRAICYQHPIKDGGVGDGKYAVELQRGMDDTFNLANDRAMLAGMPTLKAARQALDDNFTLRFAPGHVMECEETKDIEEFRISSDTSGALQQMQVLSNQMQQLTAIYPTTQGNLPAYSSTSATAIAGAESRTNQRSNYKAKTFEYTCLTELYDMILQMTYRFAEPETGYKLMGERLYDFDPGKEYWYKPLSQTIESEHSKAAKIQRYTTLLGYIAQIQHPDAPKLLNQILRRVTTLMGEEEVGVLGFQLDESQPIQQQGASLPAAQGTPTSNQYGLPQLGSEEQTRNMANMFAGMGNALI